MRRPGPSILALAAMVGGCSSLKVRSEYDPAADFSQYHRYAWLSVNPAQDQAAAISQPAVRTMVVGAIDRELASKGLVRTTPDEDPDFFVSVMGWSQSRVQVTDYGYGYYGPYSYAPGHVHAYSATQYTDGTLILDFVDARTRNVFWRGSAADTVGSASEVERSIDEATRKMLEGYPPAPGKS